jgi:hypothetical protein
MSPSSIFWISAEAESHLHGLQTQLVPAMRRRCALRFSVQSPSHPETSLNLLEAS